MTLFQKSIIEDLEEFDEYTFISLIPSYKINTLNEIINYPLWDYKENFEISDIDFEKLRKEVIELMKDEDIGLYKYKEEGGTLWEELFKKLSEKETDQFLSNKDNWIWEKGKKGYFLIRNSDIPNG
jgi:hypothetical protein